MPSKDKKETLYEDVGLLLFLLLVSATAVMMLTSGHLLANIIYMFCTVAIMIVTYFMGLLPSLLSNMVFIAGQVIYSVYQYAGSTHAITWTLSFWMVMPLLLSFALYFMTRNQVKLQRSNSELRAALIERGAFDQETNLRTTVAYVQDAAVFIETHERFDLPVTTVVIKIRYFNDLRRMMSEKQLETLLKLTSTTLQNITRDNDITYLLDNEDPTWAILLFSDSNGASIAANRIKQGFDQELKKSVTLTNLAISMVVGVAAWDKKEMNNPYDLMNAGIRETQYDV